MDTMDPRIAITVSLALILEERASVEHDRYIRSYRYDPSKPVNEETTRLKGLASKVLQGQKLPNERDTYALFCKVAQAYRLQAHSFKSHFFNS